MPYRDEVEDARVPGARRRQLVAELDGVRAVVRRRSDEATQARRIVFDDQRRLDESIHGPRRNRVLAWIVADRFGDREAVQRETRDLEGSKWSSVIAEQAVAVAQQREAVLAKRLAVAPPAPTTIDGELEALALGAAMADAVAFGHEVLTELQDAAKLVTAAHREEIAMALTGQAIPDRLLPQADAAVALTRCRVDLLHACVRALRGAAFEHAVAIEAVLAKLEAAGTGPSQEWRDGVQAAATALAATVEALRSYAATRAWP
jgi:hypothetical protein